MSKESIEKLLESAFEKVIRRGIDIKEATMNDIPHEIDDVVHGLKSMRFDMEEVKKTWLMTDMDLKPLDKIIDGINNLIKLVYDCGAELADQQVSKGNYESESLLNEDDSGKNEITEPLESKDDEEGWKKISLPEVLELLKRPENDSLNRAFKRVVRSVRNKIEDDNGGDIDEIYISKNNSLKIFFVGQIYPVFAYFDGGIFTGWSEI